jgi:glycosyltransferase involved in cell wall biosynthesis
MRALVVTNMFATPELPHEGSFVEDQIRSLRDLGHEVEMYPVHRTGQGMRVYRGLGSAVAERVAEHPPDIVHVAYGGVMAYTVTRSVRAVPVVVSFCGSDLLGADVGGAATRLRERVGVLASRRAARRAAAVIVKSTELRDALPRTEAPVWLIPNGVDLSRFAPRDRGEARRALGWDEAARIVLFPAQPSRPEKRYALARAAVDALGAGVARLEVLDGIPPADVPAHMNAVDAVLLTSAHEGSPNVVKEALACDVPVVSVDVGDVRERIEGVPGCAVVPDEPEAIARALRAAFDAERTGAGPARVADLSLERVAERVVEAYASALSR